MSGAGAIKILDAEIRVIADRLAGYRKAADKVAIKKGRRVDEADRLCDWAEHRLSEMRRARVIIDEVFAEREESAKALRVAVPYVADAVDNPLFKPGVVKRALKQIREAIAKSEVVW
jgi:hypothetical protein